MESGIDSDGVLQFSGNGGGTLLHNKEEKPKLVVIMGPTGSGKSKLAIDLAAHFPIEVINADSMQVYRGLDVLTNKVPLHDQKGVPHHLLGTVSSNMEFTAKDFRNCATNLIHEIMSRNCLPVIVGGTNYYIQALVSPFLLDDTVDDLDEDALNHSHGQQQMDHVPDSGEGSFGCSYAHLKELDPVAANRVHPNNHRKITQYLDLYSRTGILPSELFQGRAVQVWEPEYFLYCVNTLTVAGQNWGCLDNCKFNCCFICIDVAIPILDELVEQRVDCMIEAGLLNEVYKIYELDADYTRGLKQAIGVREFEEFLRVYRSRGRGEVVSGSSDGLIIVSENNDKKVFSNNAQEIFHSPDDSQRKALLAEAIDKVKANTRRLVRHQKRRVSQLEKLYGWNIQHIDATESISCRSDEVWDAQVVGPALKIITSFLNGDGSSVHSSEAGIGIGKKLVERNLWTQYTCKACGDRVLRGAHEWEQHKLGRAHRKRTSRLRKSQQQSLFIVSEHCSG